MSLQHLRERELGLQRRQQLAIAAGRLCTDDLVIPVPPHCGPNRRLLGFARILTRITVKYSRTL